MMAISNPRFNQKEREIYQGRLKWLRDEAAALEKAHENGREEGVQQGIQQGMQKGIQQRQQLARRLLVNKMPLDKITALTGLPVKVVEKLQQSKSPTSENV